MAMIRNTNTSGTVCAQLSLYVLFKQVNKDDKTFISDHNKYTN